MGSSGWACSDILILLLVFMRKLLIIFSLYSALFSFPCPLVRTKFPSRVMNDSAGKIGIDQLDQATSKGKRCAKQAEQAKALTGQHDVCRETHQVCLYYT